METSSVGVTLCKALENKYCSPMFEFDSNHMQISPKKKEIILEEMNHKKRIRLILDRCQIQDAGEEGEIRDTCPLVEEIDLSNNLISDMMQVCLIADQLKQLSFINLCANPLENVAITDPVFSRGSSYTSVEKLILNNTGISFAVLCKIMHLFPRVNELHASTNLFKEVPETSEKFLLVQSLHFSRNEISSWSNIERLGDAFPSLTTLIVCENPLGDIPESSALETSFPVLEKLSISKSMITDWQSIDQLRKIPRLSDIRFMEMPLMETINDKKVMRELLIARLPDMRVMNGGHITPEERDQAERAFLRYYKTSEDKPAPRYGELLAVHGELDDLAVVRMETPTSHVINLKGDVDACQLSVDLQMKTIDLRKLVGRTFHLELSQFRLWYHSGISDEIPSVEMKPQSRKLYYYNFSDVDDYVEVQRLDVEDGET